MTELSELRATLSNLIEHRDEISEEIKKLEERIEAKESDSRPSYAEIERAISQVLEEKWPRLHLTPAVTEVYDVYVIRVD